jgi:hypothetical protein
MSLFLFTIEPNLNKQKSINNNLFVIPQELQVAPKTGQWTKSRLTPRPSTQLCMEKPALEPEFCYEEIYALSATTKSVAQKRNVIVIRVVSCCTCTVACTWSSYTSAPHSFSTKPRDTFVGIVSCAIYWFKQLHLYTLSPSHACLKTDLGKTFQLDLNTLPPTSFIFFLLFFFFLQNVRNLLVYCGRVANIPTEPLKRPVGLTICTRSDWDFQSCNKIYILFLQQVYGGSWRVFSCNKILVWVHYTCL